jgi:copper chaperone CopZ
MENLKISIMPVTGLTCSNCAKTIETNVLKQKGITSANVDFASEKLTISFDPVLISEKEVISCVRRIGYDVATGKVTGYRDAG